jgi:hypothetical protein
LDYENDYIPFHQTVGLYTDDTTLQEIWILQLCKDKMGFDSRPMELELVKEIKFYHEPTKEEILWAMSEYGLTRYDVANVYKAMQLDMD